MTFVSHASILAALAAASAQEEAASERGLAAEATVSGAALPDDFRRGLENRLRVLDVAAHPDDEDGGLLLRFALDGAETFVVYSTRGEGGQNRIGHDLGAELGERREQEVLAAQRILGATPWFLGFEDFGFSKRADETFVRWGGREEVVRRLTAVIRELRPHRIFTNHAQSGGHGHHQATSIALHEAVVAAAEPGRFPEQIAAGAAPWRADGLFVRWFARAPAPDAPPPQPPENSLLFDYDVPSGSGERTIAALAHEALLCHVSQGPWWGFDPKAEHRAHYVLTWSARDVRSPAQLPERRAPLAAADDSPFTVDSLAAVLSGAALQDADAPSGEARDGWLRALTGADLLIPGEEPLEPRAALAPGETTTLFLLLHGRDDLYRGAECAAALRALSVEVTLDGPAELLARRTLEELVADPGARAVWRDSFATALTLRVRDDASATVPASLTERDPFPAARRHPIALLVQLARDGQRVASMRVPVEKAIAPPALAELSPSPLPLVRRRRVAEGDAGSIAATARLRLHFPTGRVPTLPLVLDAPDGFDFLAPDASGHERTVRSLPVRVDPESNLGTRSAPRFELALRLRAQRVPPAPEDGRETVVPLALRLAFADGEPVAEVAGSAAWIEARVPPAARVAFVAGADGSVGVALEAMGVSHVAVAPDAVEALDLGRFTTLLLDVRTLADSEPLRRQSARLRDWIAAGGHVVVLYHKASEWNPFAREGLTPSPLRLELTDRRICEEEAPLRIVRPADPRVLEPNVLLPRDFEGWVQERALYVPHESYDPAFDEILAGADRGEEPLRGALLSWTAPGGGSFTYCALALHRQLRAGHAGAHRLLANLVGRPSP